MTKKELNLISDILKIIAFILLIIALLRGGFQNQALKIIILCAMGVSIVASIVSFVLGVKNGRKEN